MVLLLSLLSKAIKSSVDPPEVAVQLSVEPDTGYEIPSNFDFGDDHRT